MALGAIGRVRSAKLEPQEVERLAVGLDECRQMIRASGDVFSLYDDEEKAA